MSTRPTPDTKDINIDRQQLEMLGQHFKAVATQPVATPKPPMSEQDQRGLREMAQFLEM